MTSKLQNHLSELFQTKIKTIRSLSGGSISSAYLVETSFQKYFLKVNSKPDAIAMFSAEKQGLEAITQTKTIATPKVFRSEKWENGGFLLMEFIQAKRPNSTDFQRLGEQLAKLHQNTNSEFGWENSNFIGSLLQSNQKQTDWTTFYLEERIFPQLELAQNQGLMTDKDFPDRSKMYSICQELFQNTKPSLLHGDLWNGNFVIAENGTPYLIDPAVYFGDVEVDIAMSKLFGGFGEDFYQAYRQVFPVDKYKFQKLDLYQLYYLLVHLNLFGSSYYASCRSILQKYF